MKAKIFAVAVIAAASVGAGAAQPVYLDTSRSFEERAADLVSRMTLQEKIDQLGRNTKAVPRLGVDRYDFWNEALHGIQNGTGEGTSFPMPLSLSVTWDEEFIRAVASAIADECRGHNQPLDEGGRGRGLTYWCPTINLARHPLWGRTNEAWGEDPLVAGMLSGAFVEGMKGDDAKYLKTVPTIKHYALNNQEDNRYFTNAHVSERAIREIYIRGFRIAVEESQPLSIMTSYNLLNGVHTANSYDLIQAAARDEWGFKGVVMTDWFTSVDMPMLTGTAKVIYPISASTGCIAAGNDIQMPGSQKNVDDIIRAVKTGEAVDGYTITLGDLQFNAANLIRTAIAIGATKQ